MPARTGFGKPGGPRRGDSATAPPGASDFRGRVRKIPCGWRVATVYPPRPISHVPVAACRLVGIRSTAGQPPGVLKDRWSQGWIPTAGIQVATPDPNNNRQPEAKPANPALHGGRSLKQRRTGFFGLVGPPQADTEEACFSLPGVRLGSPLPIHGSFRVLCARVRPRVSNACGRRDASPPDADGPAGRQIATSCARG